MIKKKDLVKVKIMGYRGVYMVKLVDSSPYPYVLIGLPRRFKESELTLVKSYNT